jgi:WD40 repeat protein
MAPIDQHSALLASQASDGPRRQRVVMLLMVPLLAVALLLNGCGSPAQSTTNLYPTPNTHIARAKLISGVQQLEISTHLIEIEDTVSFVPSKSISPHVLFLLVNTLYEMADDGSDLHQVPMPAPCNVSLALSPDGQWIACDTQSGRVEVVSLAASPSAGQTAHAALQLAAPEPNASITSPAWSPDPTLWLLAAMERAADGCTLLLYHMAADFHHLDQVATLTLPNLLGAPFGGSGCPIGRLAWSPDSQFIALSVTHPPDATVFTLDLSTFVRQLRAEPSAVISGRITDPMITQFGKSGYAQPAWLHLSSDSVALLATNPLDESSIIRLDTQRQVQDADVLLTVPKPYRVCGLSVNIGHTPLVFTLCASSGDRLLALPNLYVYTPSS